MVETVKTVPSTDTCARCGQVYRLPQWGRSYACPACGQGLTPQVASSPPLRIPKWVFGVTGVAVFAAAVLMLTSSRKRTGSPTASPSSPSASRLTPGNVQVKLPADLDRRFRKKIAYMAGDLKLDPNNAILITRLVHAHAALALTLRDSNRAAAEQALIEARRLADRRRTAAPQAPDDLNWVRGKLDELAWSAGDGGMMLTQMMTPQMGTPSVGTIGQGAPPPSSPPPGLTGAPPLGMSGPTPMPPMGTVSPPPGVMAPSPLTASKEVLDNQKQVLSKQLAGALAKSRQNPNDVIALESLGKTYEELANLNRDPRRRDMHYLKQALLVYQDGVRRARLRMHKAAFLRASGDVYELLHDYDNQFRVAKLASEQAPFSPSVWDELQDAALRVGRYADSRNAARKAREWTLPTVQPSTAPVTSTGGVAPPMSAPSP